MSKSEKNPIPHCVGIILDGNRRWAKERGLSPQEGHTAGFNKVKEVLAWGKEAGIRYAILYGLSTENWKRSPTEIEHLLNLFRRLTREFSEEIARGERPGLRVRFAGDLSRFPQDLRDSMHALEEQTKAQSDFTLVLALSYGGRLEILQAAQKLAREGGEITEERMNNALWTAGIPDPDVIIRPGGEHRLSNFLPWQSVYSELFFLKTHWPGFSKEDFDAILAQYAARVRNFGA